MSEINTHPSIPHITQSKTTSGMAIASLVCGLLFFIPFAFILAIVFGIIALVKINKSKGAIGGQGMAITGLVAGAMWPIFGLILAMAIPAFAKVREDALIASADNEARQVASAAQQMMIEMKLSKVEISQVQNGEYYTMSEQFSAGTDTTIEADKNGSFSLFDENGKEYFYSSEGRAIREQSLSYK